MNNEQLHEQRFHDVAVLITLGSTNGSAYSTSEPPKSLHLINYKKLCFL